MEMFLTALCLSMLGVAVAALSFGAATRGQARSAEAEPEAMSAPAMTVAMGTPKFFAAGAAVPPQQPVPLDVLLLQIERHVRLEQAAAESFIHQPSLQSLHSRTTSPLVH
jgi:hypothetical protein